MLPPFASSGLGLLSVPGVGLEVTLARLPPFASSGKNRMAIHRKAPYKSWAAIQFERGSKDISPTPGTRVKKNDGLSKLYKIIKVCYYIFNKKLAIKSGDMAEW